MGYDQGWERVRLDGFQSRAVSESQLAEPKSSRTAPMTQGKGLALPNGTQVSETTPRRQAASPRSQSPRLTTARTTLFRRPTSAIQRITSAGSSSSCHLSAGRPSQRQVSNVIEYAHEFEDVFAFTGIGG